MQGALDRIYGEALNEDDAVTVGEFIEMLEHVAVAAKQCISIDRHHKDCICSLCKALRELDEFNGIQ